MAQRAMAAHQPPVLPGIVFERLINRTPASCIWLANYKGETVAIKTPSRRLDPDPIATQRFRREYELGCQVRSAFVLRIFDFIETADELAIVMQYAPGTDLHSWFNDSPVRPGKVLNLAQQMAASIGAVHSQGIVHCDVKLGNFMLSRGRIGLIDFGIAQLPGVDPLKDKLYVRGTAHYVSPEQASADPLGYATDVYSLGICLYTLLVGGFPFSGETETEIARKHLLFAPPDLRQRCSAPEPLIQVIEKCLAKDPLKRYQDGDELKQALMGLTF